MIKCNRRSFHDIAYNNPRSSVSPCSTFAVWERFGRPPISSFSENSELVPQVDKLSMVGVNGSKFPAIRQHLSSGIGQVYKDMDTA